jgi:hypothetical protein
MRPPAQIDRLRLIGVITPDSDTLLSFAEA